MNPTFSQLLELLQQSEGRFGVLAESNTQQLTVIARNTDVSVGDLFLLPCKRGPERFYIFRTTEYANVLNRSIDLGDVARNKLTMPNSYLSKDLEEENLIQLKGIVLGYSEWETECWTFHRPRRLPEHLTDVYHVDGSDPNIAEVIRTLLAGQLGQDGLFLGNLLAGENAMPGVEVQLPASALSHHIGLFGRTGCGKTNQMMVFLKSILEHNRLVSEGKRNDQSCSILAIDPHDEFQTWHSRSGGKDGMRGIIKDYDPDQTKKLVEPFYYLTSRKVSGPGEQEMFLSWADVTPQDLVSVVEMTDQQLQFSHQFFSQQQGVHAKTQSPYC